MADGGTGAGAVIHGYVTEAFMASVMGKDAWWSVPLAVLLVGVPIKVLGTGCSNCKNTIKLVEAVAQRTA